ncbi:RagB/SusD family nutrient uptake outer membrane protein [Mucilaginibacter terrae]|uniref:SusD-like N-terminal domain-containing protein n=1 Tax=Mucilaginibacter terrae TaxID=1955052 RepID=A0ABU3GMN3_9SPHI|nr:RagB/SusD family nutrient uptake outer membrane protein [Mucilaginibacter terrae]MDT3401049.1 hypothetical protein [Mucilaginibacter terrae]
MEKTMTSWMLLTLLLGVILVSSCKKNWLNAKPSKSLVVPANVADYQALLDNTDMMNVQAPTLSMVGDGDYFIKDATYNALGSPYEKGAYVWAATADFYGGQSNADWLVAYGRILQDNVVLDGLSSLNPEPVDDGGYSNVKGSALFYRSFDFYCLSQQYCKTYKVETATTDLGLPLRISSNVNVSLGRSSLQQTYDRMINDLLLACKLLPNASLYPTRPSKVAAYGLLSRIYLSQENYGKALTYADSCLQLQNALINYNELSTSVSAPLALFNKEVIFHTQLGSYKKIKINLIFNCKWHCHTGFVSVIFSK